MFLFTVILSTILTANAEPAQMGSAKAEELGLQDLIQEIESSSPLIKAANEDVSAARAQAWQSWGENLPEIGLEGGGISDREREKRNDYFGYAYGKLRFSPKSVLEARAQSTNSDLEVTRANLHRNQILTRTSALYFDWLKFNKLQGLVEEHLRTTRSQIQMARRQLQAGRATEVDIQQFQIHEKELQKLLLLVEHEQEEAVEAIRILLGRESIELKAETLRVSSPPPTTPKGTTSLHYRMAQASSQKAQSTSLASKMSWLPEFEVSAKYGRLADTDFIESRNDSWEVIGLVRIPLFRGGSQWSKANEASSRANAERLRFQYSEDSLKSRSKLRLGHLKTLLKQRELEKESAAIADKFYSASIDQYKRGVKNASELGEASDEVFDSKKNLIELEREIHSVRLEVAELQGESVLWLIE